MTFGEKIKDLRLDARLTQSEVAKAVGISTRAYQSYEQSGTLPKSRDVFVKLSELFNVTTDWLMSDEEHFILEAGERYGSKGAAQGKRLLSEMQAYLAGGDLSEEERDEFMQSFMRMWLKTKEYAKKKYGKTTESEKKA